MIQNLKSKWKERRERERKAEMMIPRWYLLKQLKLVLTFFIIIALVFWFAGQQSMCHSMEGQITDGVTWGLYLHCEPVMDTTHNFNISLNESAYVLK